MKEYSSKIVNLPGYRIREYYADNYRLVFHMLVRAKRSFCPFCNKPSKTIYEFKTRKVRHNFWDERACTLLINQRKYKCHNCKSRFWERLPGISKFARRSESFKKQIAKTALRGHDNARVAKSYNVGQATVQRDVNYHTRNQVKKKSSALCPRVLGIDEHFFTKRKGYATTLADLGRRKVFDITLGRSEKSLEHYLLTLPNKQRTSIVVMDLSNTYRSIVSKYFPKALIVADRFHVIRLINHRFLETWKQLDPIGRQNRGLLSLFRRKPSNLDPLQMANLKRYLRSKPGLERLYDLRNDLHKLLMSRGLPKHQMRSAIIAYWQYINLLEASGFKPLISLAETLKSWQEEILRMLRFSRSNGITEGFHNKMEKISRVAYGFRNFNNYRQRVLLQCA